MVKVIMGLKGSGKTKQLVKDINEAVQSETGSVVCVEFGKKLTYDIDYRVRLIDAKEYNITDVTLLKGFISGLHAGNFGPLRCPPSGFCGLQKPLFPRPTDQAEPTAPIRWIYPL